MHDARRVAAMWSLCWVLGVGCERNLAPGPDASNCTCTKVDGEIETVRLSWPCFCAEYGCPSEPGPKLCVATVWSLACGLTVGAFENAGGVQKMVYDGTGALVGRRYATDVYRDTCHGAPIGYAAVEAGQFPDPSCPVVPCSCADGVVTCPAADAGAP